MQNTAANAGCCTCTDIVAHGNPSLTLISLFRHCAVYIKMKKTFLLQGLEQILLVWVRYFNICNIYSAFIVQCAVTNQNAGSYLQCGLCFNAG